MPYASKIPGQTRWGLLAYYLPPEVRGAGVRGQKSEERSMYAVFEDGSRQYKVSEGDKVNVDFREADAGARIEFPRVLLYAAGETLHIGQPIVEGASIVAEVVEH